MHKAQLRPLVFEAIRRRRPQTSFAEVEECLRNLTPDYRSHDGLTMRDIVWELIIQRVLAPGLNHLNPNFPFIHVTDYGQRCLEAGAILPHDPDGYLQRMQQQIGQELDGIVLTYVTEGLLTFLAGHYLSATVMLGVASERCIDLLIEAYSQAVADPTHQVAFERKVKQAGRSVKRRFDVLRDELLPIALPAELKDALDIQLSGVFTLIRYTRNDAGHPTGATVDRDTAHANLLLFPRYCKRVYDLIGYFQTNKV